jgi:hypothetical protein
MIESFEILRILEANCQLKLLILMKIHDVFHTSLLRLDLNNSLSNKIVESSSSIMTYEDDEKEFKLDDVLNSRIFKKKLQYKVK